MATRTAAASLFQLVPASGVSLPPPSSSPSYTFSSDDLASFSSPPRSEAGCIFPLLPFLHLIFCVLYAFLCHRLTRNATQHVRRLFASRRAAIACFQNHNLGPRRRPNRGVDGALIQRSFPSLPSPRYCSPCAYMPIFSLSNVVWALLVAWVLTKGVAFARWLTLIGCVVSPWLGPHSLALAAHPYTPAPSPSYPDRLRDKSRSRPRSNS